MILVAKLQKDSAHMRLCFCCCEVRVHLGSSVMRVGIASWNAKCGVTKKSEGFLDSTRKKKTLRKAWHNMYSGMLLAPFPEQTNKSSVTFGSIKCPPPQPPTGTQRG